MSPFLCSIWNENISKATNNKLLCIFLINGDKMIILLWQLILTWQALKYRQDFLKWEGFVSLVPLHHSPPSVLPCSLVSPWSGSEKIQEIFWLENTHLTLTQLCADDIPEIISSWFSLSTTSGLAFLEDLDFAIAAEECEDSGQSDGNYDLWVLNCLVKVWVKSISVTRHLMQFLWSKSFNKVCQRIWKV